MGFLNDLKDSLFGSEDQSFLNDPTANPLGFGNKATTDLGGTLAGLFERKQQGGLNSAADVLNSRGDIGPRAENAARGEIENDRQTLQQDIAQEAANSGTSGFAGTAAIQAQADAGSQQSKNDNAFAFATERADRERGDLGSIFGDLLVRPSLDLISNRPGAAENTKTSGLANFAGALGQGVNLFSSSAGGGFRKRGNSFDDQRSFNYGTSDGGN